MRTLVLAIALGIAGVSAFKSECLHKGEVYSACAAVEKYIANADCKTNYIQLSKKACVSEQGECFPLGTDAENNCHSIEMWHWFDSSTPTGPHNYAPGVNPHNAQRKTANGDDKRKTVWAYTMPVQQAEAAQVWNLKEGDDNLVSVDTLLNTPVNHITFLANVDVENATQWFTPGKNNTNGCGQLQTWELPFGFKGNATTALPTFQNNLKKIHDAGVTITMTMGSWCTQFPVMESERWSDEKFQQFVDYFTKIRKDVFGGALDGIDFDWEGFCREECLKGVCSCDWSDEVCGGLSPEDLAKGVKYVEKDTWGGPDVHKECWIMPTDHTYHVMTGISNSMKKAGYMVTLAPMSTALYTGAPDTSKTQNMRNEYAKYRKQTFNGQEVDLLDLADGIMLQWYSGFDAALCKYSNDPKACTCDNEPDADYPNTLTLENGLLDVYYNAGPNRSGYAFPKSFPVRCQACGKNVTLPDGTMGELPCANKTEEWFVPGANGTKANEHAYEVNAYGEMHKSIPFWWPKDMEVNSKCPRAIDCPDWRYKNESPYSRQIKLLKSIGEVVDLDKVSVGFETLGTDVQVQYQAYADPALPWPTPNKTEVWTKEIYNHKCTQNMTLSNKDDEMRCAQPLLSQQWGLKFKADEMVGLTDALKKETGKTLAGVGFFTVDGVLQQPQGKPARLWAAELMKLNENYKVPCGGKPCGPGDRSAEVVYV